MFLSIALVQIDNKTPLRRSEFTKLMPENIQKIENGSVRKRLYDVVNIFIGLKILILEKGKIYKISESAGNQALKNTKDIALKCVI